MANGDIVRWVTINGTHIPIREGETVDEAFKKKQIALNREEARKLNSGLPKKLNLPKIIITKNNIDDKRVLLGAGTKGPKRKFDFVQGSEIRNAYVFAGGGTSKVFRNGEFFADKYGGKQSNWQHCAGYARITDGKREFTREVHWVQDVDGIIREAFIKVRER